MPAPGGRSGGPCVFCEIAVHRAPAYVLYEDDETMAFLDIFPFTRGHFLVIPKTHSERLTDMSEPGRNALVRTLDQMLRRVGRLAPDYNLALNAGLAAGQIVFHVHFHVIPRYGESNPFQARHRLPIEEADAASVVSELSPS
jgi:histidine triad (HIT) family protein